MKIKIAMFVAGLFGAAVSQGNVEQAYQEHRLVLISDYDETLTGAGWNTLWFLKKIPALQSYLQISAIPALISGSTFESLPKTVAVTGREMGEILLERLAVVEANGKITPGSFNVQTLPALAGTPDRAQVKIFIPGVYRVTEESWERFRSDGSQFFLLEDNQRARMFERATGTSRFGPSFPLFQLLTNSRKSVDHIHVVTARAQSPSEFEGLFQSWQREGFIKNTQGQRYSLDRRSWSVSNINTYSMGEGLSLLYGDTITQRKIQIVRDQIINQYLLLAKQQQKKFTVVIAENDPGTVSSYVRMLQELMGIPDYQKQFDFIMLHAGTDFEVERSGLPARWTRIFGASLQPLDLHEIRFLNGKAESVKQKLQPHQGLTCASIF